MSASYPLSAPGRASASAARACSRIGFGPPPRVQGERRQRSHAFASFVRSSAFSVNLVSNVFACQDFPLTRFLISITTARVRATRHFSLVCASTVFQWFLQVSCNNPRPSIFNQYPRATPSGLLKHCSTLSSKTGHVILVVAVTSDLSTLSMTSTMNCQAFLCQHQYYLLRGEYSPPSESCALGFLPGRAPA